MTYDIIIGRSKKDVEKFGKRGTILVAKQYVSMGSTVSLSNRVYMDIASAHVIFVVGKRGSGKSYTMGSIAEGLADLDDEVKQNLSIVLLDTMGVYWTMKYPNYQATEMVKSWDMEPHGLDVKIFTPNKFYHQYKDEGIPTDVPFSIRPIEVGPGDWARAFKIEENSAAGVLITRVCQDLEHLGNYSIDQMIDAAKSNEDADKVTIGVVVNLLKKANGWGVFSDEGTPLKEIVKGGQVTVLDVSPYATMPGGWDIKALVTGIICRTLFEQRMLSRKSEEFKSVDAAMHYFSREESSAMDEPLCMGSDR